MDLTSKKEGSTLTVFLEGELNTMSAPELMTLLDEQMPGVDNLIFDFAKCDFVSSAGLRILLSSYKALKKSQGQMQIINIGKNFKEVLFITGLDKVFGIN